jgi:hypothetical protein
MDWRPGHSNKEKPEEDDVCLVKKADAVRTSLWNRRSLQPDIAEIPHVHHERAAMVVVVQLHHRSRKTSRENPPEERGYHHGWEDGRFSRRVLQSFVSALLLLHHLARVASWGACVQLVVYGVKEQGST